MVIGEETSISHSKFRCADEMAKDEEELRGPFDLGNGEEPLIKGYISTVCASDVRKSLKLCEAHLKLSEHGVSACPTVEQTV